MSDEHPLITRYMKRFEEALQTHDLREWREISSDLRSHIAEALACGKPLDAVLESLGPADALARGYAVELLMNARKEHSMIARIFRVAAILAASGFVTFLVVGSLGAFAVSFVGSGVVVFVIGAIEAAGVHLPGVQLAGLHPLLVMAMGPAIAAIGLAAGWVFWLYVRFLIRTLRKTLPRAWAPRAA